MKKRILILMAVLLVSVCTAAACSGPGTADSSKAESSVQSSDSNSSAASESSVQSSTTKPEASQSSRQVSQIIDKKEFAAMTQRERSKFINNFIEEYLSDDNALFKADNIYMHGEEGRMLITIQTDRSMLTQEQKDEYTKMLTDEGLINAGIPVELRIVDKNRIIIYDRVYDPYEGYEASKDDSSTSEGSSSHSSKDSSQSSKTGDNSKPSDSSKTGDSSKASDNSKTGDNSKATDNSKTSDNSKTEDSSAEDSDTQEESQEGYKYSSLEECLTDPTVQGYYGAVIGAAASYGGSASVGASGECIYITVTTDKELNDSQIGKIADTAAMYVDQANYVKGKLTELTGISGISIQLSCYDGTGSCVYSRGY